MIPTSSASVVLGVPVHNSERFLAETLESIAAQDHPNIEVVISDDASTDGTPAICEAFVRAHPRARLVRHAQRLGWVGNYNSLLRYATADCFAWIPHDDLYHPAYVRTLVTLLARRPDAVLAYSAASFMDVDGQVTGRRRGGPVMDGRRSAWRRGLRYLSWTEREKGLPFRGVIRASALRAVGPLVPVRFAADDLWLFHLALLGAFAWEGRTLLRKRKHPYSTSAQYGRRYREWDEYLAAHVDAIRAAELPPAQTALLVATVWTRRVWLAARWPFTGDTLHVAETSHPAIRRDEP